MCVTASQREDVVRIAVAEKTLNGQAVAIVQGADWVIDYVDFVDSSPQTGRPLVDIPRVPDLAKYLRSCGENVHLDSTLV